MGAAVLVIGVLVDSDVLLLPGVGVIPGEVLQAGEGGFIEGVVEPGAQRVLGVDLLANVAG